MPVCDGCGLAVEDEHIRQRIQRLELATRFRPVHIAVLLMDAAPPRAAKDFFYAAAGSNPSRPTGNAYFQELAKLVSSGRETEPEVVLAEFQRHGFFLASAVECPMRSRDDLAAAIRRLAPTILRRLQSSYKPKHVVLISQPAAELIGPLRVAGWGDRLILDDGRAFLGPGEDEGGPADPGSSLGDHLVTSISRLT